MKMFAYIVLVIVVLAIVITPLVEVAMVAKDRVLLGATIYNSCRAAKETSYTYTDMRHIDAVVDEEVFTRAFADTFATAYDMTCTSGASNPLHFESADATYGDFTVDMEFDYDTGEGDAVIVTVHVDAESQYRFRTPYMRMIDYGTSNPFLLKSSRDFVMKVLN